VRAPTIILDLDGTLLDEQPRHYGCYAAIMRELGQEALPMDAYWSLKRQAVDARGVLAKTGSESLGARYEHRWLSLIESPEMLALDALHIGTIETLQAWVDGGASLVLTSLRQSAAGFDSQLASLGLARLFPRRAVAPPREKAQGKAEAVRALLQEGEVRRVVWIGDTEVDLCAARLLGCPAWMVTCGIRSAEFLQSLRPDRLAASLADFDPFDRTIGLESS
jgi:phosphoglycolate phosphatase